MKPILARLSSVTDGEAVIGRSMRLTNTSGAQPAIGGSYFR
jgi:hypothetical protein